MTAPLEARTVSDVLARQIEALAKELLPNGHRQGAEWRCGNVDGEAGGSLGVHLVGKKAGVWSDFGTGQKGDALDLVAAALHVSMGEALRWSRRWLGLEEGDAQLPKRPLRPRSSPPPTDRPANDRWIKPWRDAVPISGTIAEAYLRGRGLSFPDPLGEVLRYAGTHPRKAPDGELERHPALLALLCDVQSDEPCGTINVYLQPDGADRLRDGKGKTAWGRAARAAVMLSPFDDVTVGLIICEGLETGLALLADEMAPVWACGGAGNVAAFPVLAGIEALTVAADADGAGRRAADTVAARWRGAGREVFVIAPPAGDWAAPKPRAA